jgi:hypothetical protein
MTRSLVPFAAPDVSALAKTLKSALDERHGAGRSPPTHVELLNLLARAVGLRNFATLKATSEAIPAPAAAPVAPDGLGTMSPTARKALLQFDQGRRLVRLPNKFSVQQMVMWALWTHFAARRTYTEKQVNAVLNAHHSFGDPATLRRELVNMKLLARKPDCSEYWKEARRPDAEVRGFLHAWRAGLR